MKKKRKLGRKLLSFLLTLAMVIGLMPGMGMTVNAATDPVPYIYYTNNASTEGTCTDYTTVDNATTAWGTAGNTIWYVVSGEVTISSRVIVNGTVNLILRDGAKLTVNGGIGLNVGNTLNIYPETEDGTGELNAVASTKYAAGIGGTASNSRCVACGTLTIHGGVIKATGAENGPGIGNSGQGVSTAIQAAGTVIIYAGNVTATGGNYGSAGIGGGWGYVGGCNVEIYGGTVLANVGTTPNGAQGIGYAGGNSTRYPGTLKIGDGVKVYSDAAGTTEIAAGPQDNVASRTNTMFVKKVKLAQTVTPPTAATGLTYKKDQAQALLTEGASVSEGNGNTEATIQYSLTPDDDTSWVAEYTDVKATNAGIHKVYYRVAGNDTYDDFVSSDEQAISVTIAQADPATPTGITAKYGDNTSKIKLPDGWTWQNDWYFFETVGTDTCKADFAGNDNYNAMTGVDITVEVDKADVAISYEKTEVSVEYGAELSQNQITNPGDADPTFTSTNKSVATVSETGYVTIKGIGETTITATIEDNEHYHYTTTQASYKLTVNPVTTEITTVPIATELTFGQKLSESTLTGGKAVLHGKWAVDGTFAWKEPDTVPNASESGEYVVVFTPDNANYSTAECNVKLTVKKASPTVTAPTAKTLNYTGSPVSLVNAGSTGDGTLYYALGENGTTAPDFDGASDTADKKWNTSIPTATNVGTYYVWYKVVGDANHNDVDAECIEVTIEEEPAKEEPKEEPKPEEPAREEPKPEEPAKEEPTTEEPVVLKPEDLDEGELVADNDGLHFYIQDNGDVTCYTANDKEVYRGFACDGTDTYFFQWDGTAMRDRLTYHPDGEHVIYFDENGHEVFNDFTHVKHSIAGEEVDDYCFFNVYGYMYVDVITYDKTGTVLYYINPYGVMEIDKWFQFSDTVKWGDDMPTEGIAEGYGYANADGTLMKDQITYDWEGRQCYMQGNGVALY